MLYFDGESLMHPDYIIISLHMFLPQPTDALIHFHAMPKSSSKNGGKTAFISCGPKVCNSLSENLRAVAAACFKVSSKNTVLCNHASSVERTVAPGSVSTDNAFKGLNRLEHPTEIYMWAI